jgi:hypothetical protein
MVCNFLMRKGKIAECTATENCPKKQRGQYIISKQCFETIKEA